LYSLYIATLKVTTKIKIDPAKSIPEIK
jgi:hypothetical protein